MERKKTFIRGKMFNIFGRHFNDFARDIWAVNFNFPSLNFFFFYILKMSEINTKSCGNKKIKNCPFASNGQQKKLFRCEGRVIALNTHMYNINSLEGKFWQIEFFSFYFQHIFVIFNQF